MQCQTTFAVAFKVVLVGEYALFRPSLGTLWSKLNLSTYFQLSLIQICESNVFLKVKLTR